MTNSFKLSSKKCALLMMLILLTLAVSTVSRGETTNTSFADDFEGTVLDPEKWVVTENTDMSGYPAHGGSVQVANGYLLLSSNGSSFPFIHSAVNPFPASGDFSVEFAVTYSCIGDSGCGIMISNGMPTLDYTWHNKIVTLWAHDQGPDNTIIYLEFLNSLVYKMNIPGFKPSSPQHLYKVTYRNGIYDIHVDGAIVASAESQQRPTMIMFGNPPNPEVPLSPQTVAEWGYWGWSSFKVDSIKVESEVPDDNLPQTTQTDLSTTAETQQLGYKIGINGNLTSEGLPLPDAQIVLSYSLPGASIWLPISSVTTNQGGAYSASWIPTATGLFTLKAEYAGDENFVGSYAVKNISIIESTGKEMFFVESNSTISSLAFNSTSSEISFTVSGSAGTTGYARFIVSKELVSDPSALKVYLDGNRLEYTVTDRTDAWQLYFAYKHSTHTVLITMIQPLNSYSIYITAMAIGIFALATAPSLLIYYFTKHKR
jgi:hypothetical protein